MRELCVILDTNFLMIPENSKVDIFSELDRLLDKKYKLVVPEAVIEELKNLKEEGTSSEKKSAGIALELSDKAEIIESQKPADEEILRVAKERDCIVGTNDSKLKKRLRKEGIPVTYLRQRSYLAIDGLID